MKRELAKSRCASLFHLQTESPCAWRSKAQSNNSLSGASRLTLSNSLVSRTTKANPSIGILPSVTPPDRVISHGRKLRRSALPSARKADRSFAIGTNKAIGSDAGFDHAFGLMSSRQHRIAELLALKVERRRHHRGIRESLFHQRHAPLRRARPAGSRPCNQYLRQSMPPTPRCHESGQFRRRSLPA